MTRQQHVDNQVPVCVRRLLGRRDNASTYYLLVYVLTSRNSFCSTTKHVDFSVTVTDVVFVVGGKENERNQITGRRWVKLSCRSEESDKRGIKLGKDRKQPQKPETKQNKAIFTQSGGQQAEFPTRLVAGREAPGSSHSMTDQLSRQWD